MNKIAALAISGLGGASALYYFLKPEEKKIEEKSLVNCSTEKFPQIQQTESESLLGWDDNWDWRKTKEAVKHPRAVRHLILVRHGQYNLKGASDNEKVLTEVGRKQAELTGKRLTQLELPITNVVMSTMTRAQETGNIILNQLNQLKPLKIVHDSMIREGEPIQEVPMTPSDDYPLPHRFFQEGARIEAGFRAHFHRAPPSQENETYTLMVCHANVIRYFICRALQLPPEAWLRFNLHNASISWLSIFPNGKVSLRLLGDCGHIPENLVTRT